MNANVDIRPVALKSPHTLWFNTGTLCNIACAGCSVESAPRWPKRGSRSRSTILIARGSVSRVAGDAFDAT